MADIGHPILGDQTYGLDGTTSQGKGLYLHAYCIKFDHPITKTPVEITAELPKKFTKIIESV